MYLNLINGINNPMEFKMRNLIKNNIISSAIAIANAASTGGTINIKDVVKLVVFVKCREEIYNTDINGMLDEEEEKLKFIKHLVDDWNLDIDYVDTDDYYEMTNNIYDVINAVILDDNDSIIELYHKHPLMFSECLLIELEHMNDLYAACLSYAILEEYDPYSKGNARSLFSKHSKLIKNFISKAAKKELTADIKKVLKKHKVEGYKTNFKTNNTLEQLKLIRKYKLLIEAEADIIKTN